MGLGMNERKVSPGMKILLNELEDLLLLSFEGVQKLDKSQIERSEKAAAEALKDYFEGLALYVDKQRRKA